MANLCVNDTGFKTARKTLADARDQAAVIRRTVMVVQAALSAADAISNFRKLRDVSSRALQVEEQQQGHLRDTYWPAEIQFLNEFTQGQTWDAESDLARRYAGRLWPPLAAAFQRKREKIKCDAPRYCGNALSKALQELTVEEANTRANVTLLAGKIAFEEVQAVRETDFERRKQAIALRQGLVGQAASLMRAAADGFSGALSNSMAEFNSALGGIGYESTRRNPDTYTMNRLLEGRTPNAVINNTTPSVTGADVMPVNVASDLSYPGFDIAQPPAGDYTGGQFDGVAPGEANTGDDPNSWVK